MSDRLIGPKTWNRNVKIFRARLDSAQTIWALFDEFHNKLCFSVYEAGNGYVIRFHKVEPMCVEWATHGQPTVMFLGLLKTVPVGLNWTKNVHVWCV